MDFGILWTRWTVRVAIAFYVASLASRGNSPKWSRAGWTAGCLAYLLHVACAFQYYHHWTHAEAYAFAAQQTADVAGLNWGGGLYVNYAFTLVWVTDVCWWWGGMERYLARPRLIECAVQGFLGFIAFNATVVFATGFSRWFGLAACVLLVVILIGRWYSDRAAQARRQDE
jgi:hypothetical protein